MDGPVLKAGALKLLEQLASVIQPDTAVRTRLGGLAPGNCGRNFQLFSSITTPGFGIADFQPLTFGVTDASEQFRPDWCGLQDRLWRVRTSGKELQRSAGDPTAPLLHSQIVAPNTTALPAGTSRGGSVTYKLQVKVRSNSGLYQFFMDAGQPIEVVGKDVSVGIFGPTNAFVVTSNTNTNQLRGILLDAVLGVSIDAAEQSLAQHSVRLTQHFFVLLNTRVSIPVPNYARQLAVFTGTGPNPAAWDRLIGDPALITNALRTGTVDFAGPTSTRQSSTVGDETHLRTDLDVNNSRFFTVVWTIRP